jgi:hypothetical protein
VATPVCSNALRKSSSLSCGEESQSKSVVVMSGSPVIGGAYARPLEGKWKVAKLLVISSPTA